MISIEEAYREHSQMIYRYLFSLTHNADVAEELTQETFYQAVKSIGKYDGECKLSTWLCAIAKNKWRQYARKNHVLTEYLDEDVPTDSAEDQAISKLGQVELMKQIHKLKECEREVMYLRIYGNLSFRQIGEIMGKTENWARVTFYRAKVQVRKEIDADE